jgi:protein SCO1/2
MLAIAGVAGWAVLPARTLPVAGTVPDFALTERTGSTVSAADLSGRVWIANFVFTRCPDVCPALTARMATLSRALPAGADGVRLVSFSVDPGHDTPAVLQAYAARAGAGPDWLFLTGSRAALATLLRDGFRLAWADGGPPTAPITHSDRFVLVDRALRIRGYYHGSDPAELARLERDARTLRDERRS